jgi:hypothetical protein
VSPEADSAGFKPWESDHTALVHVLWDCHQDGLSIGHDRTSDGAACDEVGHRIMQSRWISAVRAEAGAKSARILAEMYRGGWPLIAAEMERLTPRRSGSGVYSGRHATRSTTSGVIRHHPWSPPPSASRAGSPGRTTVAEHDEIEIHEAEEWAAVYLNGHLQHVGDTYLADEWIREHFGVKTIQDDAFMRGQTSRDGVAQTVHEVNAYIEDREAKLRRAAELREEAARLLAEAEEVSRG